MLNKRAEVALNRSPVLCAPVLFSGLNHLVEGNQADLFCGFRRFFSCLPYINLYKTCGTWAGPFLTPISLFEQTW